MENKQETYITTRTILPRTTQTIIPRSESSQEQKNKTPPQSPKLKPTVQFTQMIPYYERSYRIIKDLEVQTLTLPLDNY